MRFEIVIFLITGLIIANVYTDGKYLKLALTWKKYYQMIGIGFMGLTLCWLLRKDPSRAKSMIISSNEYLKYLPVDKNTTSFISPILDFTAKQNFRGMEESSGGSGGISNSSWFGNENNENNQYKNRILQSGKTGTKRSVSETKKKFVASSQNWECGDCKKKLPAWFEVDHTIRLENGGSNNVDNLVALCRDCHGKKTAIENL
jgi:5-methylcytosine-specific restriction endonuclease McrA